MKINNLSSKENPNRVDILENQLEISEYLKWVIRLKPRVLCFEFITTGINPKLPGHRIIACSMSWQNNRSVSWRWKKTPIKQFRYIMESEEIGKIVFDIAETKEWMKARVPRTELNGRLWDSSETEISNINRIDPKIDPLLIPAQNSFNRVFEIPINDLLLYVGKKTLNQYRKSTRKIIKLGIL